MSSVHPSHVPPPAVPATLITRSADLAGRVRRIGDMIAPLHACLDELQADINRAVAADSDAHRDRLAPYELEARMLAIVNASGIDAVWSAFADANIIV